MSPLLILVLTVFLLFVSPILVCSTSLIEKSLPVHGIHTLPVAPIPSNEMHFVSLGDWGSPGPDQTGVAKQIGLSTTSFNVSLLLALGDNFYEDGVVSDTDPQWTSTYKSVYTATSLDVPWYSILGNHDHHLGRGQGEIDYYKNHRDDRWVMPDYWYTQVFHLEASNITVEMVFIDTVILSGDPPVYWPDQSKAQYIWINQTLGASTADWLFVIGHYPVYSGGEHGNTPDLDTNLLPLLRQNNVDFYLCGHDHNLQHLHESPTTTQYFVSGNGAKRGSYSPTAQSLWGVVDPGFMLHSITGLDTMSTTVIDLAGKVVYSYTQKRIPKRHEQERKRVGVV